MIPPTASRVLLTGATGFLGHYLLARLLTSTKAHVRALIRPAGDAGRRRLGTLLGELQMDLDDFISQGRVEFVYGEIPYTVEPSIFAGVDTVVHAAACTRFDADGFGEPHRTNVLGTRVLLEGAARFGVRHFVHVSTAFVCGTLGGCIPESFVTHPPGFCNDYERSKWVAERLVWNWRRRGRIATICRPSILFGDRTRGRMTSPAGVYLIARATEILARAVADDATADRFQIPLRILGRETATCNLVPVDWVAENVVEAVCDPRRQGRIHHLTNPFPPTHAEVKSWLEEYFDIGGGRFSDLPWPLKDPNHYEDMFYSVGNVVRDYFRDGLTFSMEKGQAQCGAERLVDRALFHRSLQFGQSHHWGRRFPTAQSTAQPSHRVDAEWYFEKYLPATLPKSRVARVHALTADIRFIVGAPPRDWLCSFRCGQLVAVRRGLGETKADFGFRITPGAFFDVIAGRRPLQGSFFAGEADILGNVERALRMVPIMAGFVAEFPVHVERPL